MPTDEQKSVFLQELEKEEEVKKTTPEKKVKKKMSATALFATIFILFLVLIALFIFIMSIGGAGNPILKTFGVPEDGAKRFLLDLVNGTFATIGIILLITFTIALFIGFSTKKEEKLKRRGIFVFSAVSGGLIFISIFFWLGTWSFVNAIVVEASTANLNIEIDVPDPDNIIAPIDVTFSAEKIHAYYKKKGFSVIGFKWDFGEGKFLPIQTEDRIVRHFDTSGIFDIKIEIVGEGGASDIYTRQFEIKSAQFAANPASGNAPLKVEFDASAITRKMTPRIFEWDFDGDGEFEQNTTSSKITHTFEKIGRYKVQLRVVDSDGIVKRFSREIVVLGEDTSKIQAKINAYPASEGSPPFEVQFDGKESFSIGNNINKFEWDFDDGTPKDSGEIVEHIFKKEGVFQVKLTITDELGSQKTAIHEINVKKAKTAPTAVIRTNAQIEKGKISGTLPFTVKFDASGSTDDDDNIIRYEWDFNGDGNVDTAGVTAEYTFREIGETEVNLIVTDADNNIDTETILVEVKKQSVVAEIVANPETGSVPLTVKFDGSKSKCDEANCNIMSYEWDFGDGKSPQLAGAQIQRIYSKVGIYDVKLTIYTSNDKVASTNKKIYVREIPLTACFDPTRSSGKAPLTITFDSYCSVGPIDKWYWEFGDGATSQARKPSYTFNMPGKYSVKLKIFDDKDNVSETSKEIEVTSN